MKNKGTGFSTKISLVISVMVVIPISLVYGFKPELLLDIDLVTNDEYNFAKGVMGLYLAFALFWGYGLINSKVLKLALISNVLFMLGLVMGRSVSVLVDGWPSAVYMFGFFGELVLGLYSLYMLSYKHIPISK